MTIKDNGDGTFGIVAPCSFEKPSREEALKLADELESLGCSGCMDGTNMIRRLVEELNRLIGAEPITHGKLTFCKNCGQQDPYTQTKPLSDEEIEYYEHLIAKLFNCSITQKVVGLDRVIRAIEERHGIK